MARMIPPVPHPDSPPGEKRLFDRLREDPGTEGWTVLHSLDIAKHQRQVAGEADFVVIAPELGVLCLEVKSHRRVRRDGEGLWHLGSDAPTQRSPFGQAKGQMYSILEFLHRKGMDLRDVPLGWAVWFTSANASVLGTNLEWHDWQLLDRADLRPPVSTTLAEVMRHNRDHLAEKTSRFAASATGPDTAQCRRIAQELRPTFEAGVLPADIREARDTERVRFLDEQLEALDVMEDQRRVLFTGAAGTGKTFLAVEAARRATGKGLKVRVLCFNNALAGWMADTLGDSPEVSVSTLHSLMLEVTGAHAPPSPGRQWWEEELPELAANILLENGGWECDLLIVDEAQDLCAHESYLDLLDLLVPGGLAGGNWLMFGDFDQQAIYGSEDGRVLLDQRSPQHHQHRLYRNCRNTPRIGHMAMKACGLEGLYAGFRRPDDEIDVTVLAYSDDREQEGHLISALKELRENHYPAEQIVVLSPRKDGMVMRMRDSATSGRIAPYGRHGKRTSYSTVHAFKGLDAPAVVITDIDSADSDRYRFLLYIGMSRAADRLVVLAHKKAVGDMLQAMTGGEDHT
ncbi:UvrD-like helicase family protein [Nocardiopsis sp. Huas11]|uniref:nuclease-related domain-containing DEAD/DEAH box helicase n=1 Tax=Nocardiopsis sp. Huas11 TaxID=2183912 RepID=UPI000EB163C4|nr:ATP-binding domain-containing protein [Nocardiopsis sp. Huas11]RKS05904.1 UvrD-like helicase family protein [Nocardiopsis sp. Huas11]